MVDIGELMNLKIKLIDKTIELETKLKQEILNDDSRIEWARANIFVQHLDTYREMCIIKAHIEYFEFRKIIEAIQEASSNVSKPIINSEETNV